MAATATTKTGPFGFNPARSDALSQLLAQHWWAVGLRGILAIIFGLLCLLTPGIAVGAFIIVFAAYMFVDGVFATYPAYAQLAVASSGACSFLKAWLILLLVSLPLSGLRLRSSRSCGSLPFGQLFPAH